MQRRVPSKEFYWLRHNPFWGRANTPSSRSCQGLGLRVYDDFFDRVTAQYLATVEGKCDLIIANNVFAHVPNINAFAEGLKTLLNENGTITIEIQHLLNIIKKMQFDTLYHEHFSYLSVMSVRRILQKQGLRIFKVEKLFTHGGSLRVFCCHSNDPRQTCGSVTGIIEEEIASGLADLTTYSEYQHKIEAVSRDLRGFFAQAKNEGKVVVGYGAAAKGNTLLNYSGISQADLGAIFDAAASKHNKFMPQSGIPILPPSRMAEFRPDYVLILPWNIADEICNQIKGNLPQKTRFVSAIPEITFHD